MEQLAVSKGCGLRAPELSCPPDHSICLCSPDWLVDLMTVRFPHRCVTPYPYRSAQRRRAGFTLLEMLVVLVIIGLLAGLVGPRLFSKVDQSKVTTAQTQVKLLRGAVESVRLDVGRYPTVEEGLELLMRAPSDPVISTRWRGPYLDGAVPLDPWGSPYQYGIPGAGGQGFALYSLGADSKRGGEGDAADIGVLPVQ